MTDPEWDGVYGGLIREAPDAGRMLRDRARIADGHRPIVEITLPPARCPGCGVRDDVPVDSAPLPQDDEEARSYCITCGRRTG